LTWSDYRELLSLKDAAKRAEVSEKAAREKWDTKRIRSEVKKVNEVARTGVEPTKSLTAKPGTPGTYKIVKATVGPEAGKGVIDLGFSNYYKTSKDLRFKEGAIIEATPPFAGFGSSPSDMIRLSKRTAEDLYTYRADVAKVLDGDTIKAVVDLGFGVRSVQTLRLRGIDAPEIATADGMAAKKALEKMLGKQAGAPVLIKTVKSDKYDRYLVDVFVGEVYVNQQLVENGFAVIVEA